MLAWAKVVIEKFVFKGKDKVMAVEIQPQSVFFFGHQWYEGRDRGKLKQASSQAQGQFRRKAQPAAPLTKLTCAGNTALLILTNLPAVSSLSHCGVNVGGCVFACLHVGIREAAEDRAGQT